jgi:hypothetical protein
MHYTHAVIWAMGVSKYRLLTSEMTCYSESSRKYILLMSEMTCYSETVNNLINEQKAKALDVKNDPDDLIVDWSEEDPEARYAMVPVPDTDEDKGNLFTNINNSSFANGQEEWEIAKEQVSVKVKVYDANAPPGQPKHKFVKEQRTGVKIFPDGSIQTFRDLSKPFRTGFADEIHLLSYSESKLFKILCNDPQDLRLPD